MLSGFLHVEIALRHLTNFFSFCKSYSFSLFSVNLRLLTKSHDKLPANVSFPLGFAIQMYELGFT